VSVSSHLFSTLSDIVTFGNTEENKSKLDKLFQAVNSGESSHLIESPAGSLLSDVVLTSPICLGENAPPPGTAVPSSTTIGEEFDGVNPSTDPELYMALRMSLEEERARQQREQPVEVAVEPSPPSSSSSSSSSSAGTATAAVTETTIADAPVAATDEEDAVPVPTVEEIEGMDVDEELKQALLLSLQDFDTSAPPADNTSESKEEEKPSNDIPSADGEGSSIQDLRFVQQLIGDLPGVDVNDPRIEALRQETTKEEKEEEKKDDSAQ